MRQNGVSLSYRLLADACQVEICQIDDRPNEGKVGSQMLPVKLAGLGGHLPPRGVTNAELEERVNIPADWIERVTGVCERRYVTSETVVAMGAAASSMALEEAGVDVSDLDAIICAS